MTSHGGAPQLTVSFTLPFLLFFGIFAVGPPLTSTVAVAVPAPPRKSFAETIGA